MREVDISLTVNGQRHNARVEARRTLADFLRHSLGLTGTHLGCEHGSCGACTVVVDGQSVRSCLMLAAHADGHEVITVEGLSRDGEMHAVQQALWDSHAFQCGFCTPGFVMSIYAMYNAGEVPASREELRQELSGHICRCSGYQAIIDGAEAALAGAKKPVAAGTSAGDK